MLKKILLVLISISISFFAGMKLNSKVNTCECPKCPNLNNNNTSAQTTTPQPGFVPYTNDTQPSDQTNTNHHGTVPGQVTVNNEVPNTNTQQPQASQEQVGITPHAPVVNEPDVTIQQEGVQKENFVTPDVAHNQIQEPIVVKSSDPQQNIKKTTSAQQNQVENKIDNQNTVNVGEVAVPQQQQGIKKNLNKNVKHSTNVNKNRVNK